MKDDVFGNLMSELHKEYRRRQDIGYRDGLYRAHQLILELLARPNRPSFTPGELTSVAAEIEKLREEGYWASSTLELDVAAEEDRTPQGRSMELKVPDFD